jgi:hypothetical protein
MVTRSVTSMAARTIKREWSLVDIYMAERPETCLCGHHPIIEMCVIRNRLNGNEAEVGNVCVKQFFEIRSDLIFATVKRIRQDLEKGLNEPAIVLFREKGLISEKEYSFLLSTARKRVLSFAQMNWRKYINARILRAVARGRLD